MNETSPEWPTEHGWYWVRDGDRELEVGRVIGAGPKGETTIHGVGSAFAYKSEWPNLRWLERIPEPPAADAEACWHIMDTRQVVGNCALWWGPDRNGYTCNLDEAGLYTRKQAFAQHASRSSDVPVHRDVAHAASVTHVRAEPLWDDEVTGAILRAARDARIEADRRADELSESELQQYVDECDPFAGPDHIVTQHNPFDGDYGPEGLVVLKDKLVTGRKPHKCHDCQGEIAEGLRHRYRAERSDCDKGVSEFRWCHDCSKKHMGYPYGCQEAAER